jgi:hypothetical protein
MVDVGKQLDRVDQLLAARVLVHPEGDVRGDAVTVHG